MSSEQATEGATEGAKYFDDSAFDGPGRRKFVQENATMFGLTMVCVLVKKEYPDSMERKSFVDTFIRTCKQRTDQELAKRREIAGSLLGGVFSAVMGTMKQENQSTAERIDALRSFLYEVMDIEAAAPQESEVADDTGGPDA